MRTLIGKVHSNPNPYWYPNLTSTLKPCLNVETVVWSCKDQQKEGLSGTHIHMHTRTGVGGSFTSKMQLRERFACARYRVSFILCWENGTGDRKLYYWFYIHWGILITSLKEICTQSGYQHLHEFGKGQKFICKINFEWFFAGVCCGL